MPVSEVLNHARAVAFQIGKYSARLSAASGRRITARTAIKLNELADQVQRIDIERERGALGSSESLIREAQRLITEIANAARFAAVADPEVGRQLGIVRKENHGRSRNALWWALFNHGELVKRHPRAFARNLPKTIHEDIERLRAALMAHEKTIEKKREARAEVSKKRAELIREIRAIVGETRALAVVVFRAEPETLRLFQMPKRRPSRKPPVTAPS